MSSTRDTRDTSEDAIDIIADWSESAPSWIADVLGMLGFGKWSAREVRQVLQGLGVEVVRSVPADDYGNADFGGHCGKFARPWFAEDGRDTRDKGLEKGGALEAPHSRTDPGVADRMVQVSEEAEAKSEWPRLEGK